MTRAWRRLMNAWEVTGKLIYGLLGSRFPITSLLVVTLLGASIGGLTLYAIWSSFGDAWIKDHPPPTPSQLHLEALKQVNAERKAEIKQPVLAAYQSEITFDCPENVSLRIFGYPNGSLAKFTKNGVKATSGAFSLEIRGYRTFSSADKGWRNTNPFSAEIAKVPTLQPAHSSKELILIQAHKAFLEIGNRGLNEYLAWPPADPDPLQRYLLDLRILGLETEKVLRLCVRWERGTDKLGFMEYSENIPASAL